MKGGKTMNGPDAAEPERFAESVIPLRPIRLEEVPDDSEDSASFRGEVETVLGEGRVVVNLVVSRASLTYPDVQQSISDFRVGLAVVLTPEAAVEKSADSRPGEPGESQDDELDDEQVDIDIEVDFTQWRFPDPDSPSLQTQVLFSVDPPIGDGRRHRYRVRKGIETPCDARIEVRAGSVELVRLPDGASRTAHWDQTTPWMRARRFRVVGRMNDNFYRFDGRGHFRRG